MASVESVKELILDEQKLVTYVSLSKELCIHINDSKNLLRLVVDEIKEKQPDVQLNINFIVSGLLNDNNSARTLVCSEKDLDDQKTKFKNVFFQHIYSVSQGLSNMDCAALVSVNRFEDFPLCTGLIKSNSCSKRTTDEIGALKYKSQAAVNAQATSLPPEKDKPVKIVQNKTETKPVVKVQVQTAKSEPTIKAEVISPKKVTSSSSSISNGKANNLNGKKPAKGITGFFSKANSAPTIKSKPAQENGKNKKGETTQLVQKKVEDIKSEEMDVDIKEEVPVERIKEKPVSKEPVEKKTKEEPKSAPKAASKNSLSKIKKTAKVDKKRKRVLHVSDSESEEDPFADEKPALQESDDEIPPTPSVNTVKITSGILNPKKRRKVVDKTYTDEEGYILTRKEEVYESCSDDEEIKQPEVKPEKENVEKPNKIKTETHIQVSPSKKAKISKKKISPPQKGKQATMMNFFKKV